MIMSTNQLISVKPRRKSLEQLFVVSNICQFWKW